jgi:hypothetical protein
VPLLPLLPLLLSCRGVSTGEVQMGQSQYQRAMGWSSGQANTGVITYTFHW